MPANPDFGSVVFVSGVGGMASAIINGGDPALGFLYAAGSAAIAYTLASGQETQVEPPSEEPIVVADVPFDGFGAGEACNKGFCAGGGGGGKVYGPNRKLPRTKGGDPVPESKNPHTQLGKKGEGEKSYTQGREFGKDGKAKRDLDFTDHGDPKNHPNPHQHRLEPNNHQLEPKGGYKRLPPEPFP